MDSLDSWWFGKGVVKITSAHSKTDYEVAIRHRLPLMPVIDQNGLIWSEFQEFAGIGTIQFSWKNLFVSKADHKLELPISSRSKDLIELMIPQWILKCDQMSTEAINAVENGRLTIELSRFQNKWKRWFEDSIDWCLSRQIWWGHYGGKHPNMY